MKNQVNKEQFCGIDLYNWKEWDIMGTDNFYFYNVEFLVPSMKKYNGMDVSRFFDGRMEIYGGENAEKAIWSGYVTDIPEIIEELNKRK